MVPSAASSLTRVRSSRPARAAVNAASVGGALAPRTMCPRTGFSHSVSGAAIDAPVPVTGSLATIACPSRSSFARSSQRAVASPAPPATCSVNGHGGAPSESLVLTARTRRSEPSAFARTSVTSRRAPDSVTFSASATAPRTSASRRQPARSSDSSSGSTASERRTRTSGG